MFKKNADTPFTERDNYASEFTEDNQDEQFVPGIKKMQICELLLDLSGSTNRIISRPETLFDRIVRALNVLEKDLKQNKGMVYFKISAIHNNQYVVLKDFSESTIRELPKNGNGATPLGKALFSAADAAVCFQAECTSRGQKTFAPLIFIFTDGDSTEDEAQFLKYLAKVKNYERSKQLLVVPYLSPLLMPEQALDVQNKLTMYPASDKPLLLSDDYDFQAALTRVFIASVTITKTRLKYGSTMQEEDFDFMYHVLAGVLS